MKNRKILYVSHSSDLSGAPRSLLNLAEEIIKYDIIPVVILPSQGPIIRELRKRGIKYYIVKYTPCYSGLQTKSIIKDILNKEYNNLVAAVKIVKIIKKERIDIIHSNSIAVDVGAMAARLTGVSHVWHIREFMEEDHGLRINFKRKTGYLLRHSKRVIAVSDSVFKKYKSLYKLNNIERIYNGIPIGTYLIEKEALKNENGLRILICGALNEGKGQLEAIKAMKNLMDFQDISLYIAGKGEEKYEKMLRKFIAENDLQKRVIFLGQLNNMLKLREMADIELVCSKAEAFGRVTIEAMLGQVLVIGADTAGTREIIIDKKTGVLYHQGDYNDLAEKILDVYKNKGKYRIIIQKAKKYAEERFNIKQTVRNIIRLYDSI